jgi:6-phosphogluconolactonase
MIEEFESRNAASEYVADLLSARLRKKLAAGRSASLVVSGGKSPIECLNILSDISLDWSRVIVTLTDERIVPSGHLESNERLVRENLFTGNACVAQFVPLVEGDLQALMPFTCTLVGMGEDGHFASIFPDSEQLQQALTSASEIIKVETPSSPYERVSMTLNTINQSEELVLLVFGQAKRKILNNPEGLPVEKLLQNDALKVIWAP